MQDHLSPQPRDLAIASRRRGDIPVSVVIPVRNEEKNLPHCLAALSQFAEIFVVDSASTDNTVEIAQRLGATVVQFEWDGQYPKKRNWALLSLPFSNEWIFFLDADEIVGPDFCSELEHVIASSTCNGYWLNYTNYFRGRKLRYGVAQRKLAIIRRGAGLYEKIEEDRWSSLDMEVHEHPVVGEPIGEIHTQIDHRDFRGLGQFLLRHIEYADWEARRHAALKADQSWHLNNLTARQKFKYRYIEKWWYAPFYFFFNYIFCRGILDGAAGFSYSLYKFWYFYTIRQLIQRNFD